LQTAHRQVRRLSFCVISTRFALPPPKRHQTLDLTSLRAYNGDMDSEIVTGAVQPFDDVDRYLVDALRKDGREPFAQIAERLAVSPGMIRQRYNRLVEQGYLKVVAITNPLQRGFKTMAMIGVRTDGNRMLEVAERISRLEEVVYLVVASGRFDILAEVFCRDHEDLLRFITERLYGIEGVRETETFMHLRIVKEIYF
jgi:Lrp/AsnC family transcriptional regulator for asnA, asnC and gidA